MAYGRNDRDFSSHGQDDDRRRLSGRWNQDEDGGFLRRHFDEEGQVYGEYGGDRRQEDYEDHRDWGSRGGYRGDPDLNQERSGGHAYDFTHRDLGRSGFGNQSGRRAFEGQERLGNAERYGGRSGGGLYDYYGDRTNESSRGGWPREGSRIDRYVSAEGRASMGAGSFRGKGPKGYVRSDERIKEDVSDRLSDDDTLDASEITVEVSSGEVTLSGYVDSRQAKRTAEDCAEQCAGVTQVQNNLRVRSGSETVAGSTSSGGQFTDRTKTAGL